jgi:hypothetical protein
MTHSALLLLTGLLAQASTTSTFSVDPQQSLLRFSIVHKFHRVQGESKHVQGKALLKPDGTLQVMIRATIGSFQSGDGNRDEHMRETLEEPKYPVVVYKGVGRLADGAALPPKLDLVLDGELDFHGQKRVEKVSVHVDTTQAGEARATGHFVVSLDRYQIDRPSLLFIKIDDACAIDFDLRLHLGAH